MYPRSTPTDPEDHSRKGLGRYLRRNLNFYRIHILVFTFTPLIFSAILYASNGKYPISYVDALFNSVSSMAVCGLATVDLSALTPWQQFLLFIQMCLGSPVVVSWVMVYMRRYFFAKSFEHMIEAEAVKRNKIKIDIEATVVPWHSTIINLFRRRKRLSAMKEESQESDHRPSRERVSLKRLRTDMIRRMDEAPKLVNPSGWISEGRTEPVSKPSTVGRSDSYSLSAEEQNRQLAIADRASASAERSSTLGSSSSHVNGGDENALPISRKPRRERGLSDPGALARASVSGSEPPFPRYPTINVASYTRDPSPLPRTQTVEFAPAPRRQRFASVERDRARRGSLMSDFSHRRQSIEHTNLEDRRPTRRPSLALRPTLSTHSHYPSVRAKTKHRGFGGFPMPHEIVSRLFQRLFPHAQEKLHRNITIPLTRTIASTRGETSTGVKTVPYISFDAVVGRNSAFYELTNEQLEELGGVEYRALNALLWIVAGYHIIIQLSCFVIIASYMSESRWKEDFVPPALHRSLSPAWFALFQVVSAYTNTGTSLVDQSIVPFQKAYPMIIFLIILILAGNTAFPIFLRLTIWTIAKLVPERSRLSETLHFLLDHPRRCFIYLFPSHQTWFLVIVLLILNFTDWLSFLILDIGTPTIEAVPAGTRVIIGLLQATAVRSAGFVTVSLSSLAPAVKVLYVIMMYISVYPIAMSVRSTNVYEEQSLGVFEDRDDPEEYNFPVNGPRVSAWSHYLGWHARKQLAFDMWWLGLALVLVCIIERPNLDKEEDQSWFNIFAIMFELVSAYGTVGLSLGIPTENYSFSGAFRPLSKLIVCFVMIRGRHRGLPVAIDRAVMLPVEFSPPEDGDVDDQRSMRSARSEFGRSRRSQVIDESPPEEIPMNGIPETGNRPTEKAGSMTRTKST